VEQNSANQYIFKNLNQETLIRPKENACFVGKILSRNGPGTAFADAASN
jgi:hypothetical protein